MFDGKQFLIPHITVANKLMSIRNNLNVRTKLSEKGYMVCDILEEDREMQCNNSPWGINVTDQTLKVGSDSMPIIRRPINKGDHQYVGIDNFNLVVGNETNTPLVCEPLRDHLKKWGFYLERDEQIMFSAQACVIPLTDEFSTFSVNVNNYLSTMQDPSVVTIIASAQGTSTVSLTQRYQTLYFNKNGRAHLFQIDHANGLPEICNPSEVSDKKHFQWTVDGKNVEKEEKNSKVLLVFHIPLIRKSAMQLCNVSNVHVYASVDHPAKVSSTQQMDAAMLRLIQGDKGKYPSLKTEKKYIRDPSLPIQCVAQHYVGSDTGEVTDDMIEYIDKCLVDAYECVK